MLGQVLQMAVQLAGIAVLARILDPDDYGLIMMAGTVLAILELFKEMGLPTATVQRKEITDAEVSNLFWINVLVGALLSILLAAVAPAVAWFYQDPRLTPVVVALSIGLFLTGLSAQHRALLRRHMEFRALAVINLLALFVGTAIGIVAALRGAGYWSLVLQSIAIQLCTAVSAWVACSWRPQRFDRQTSVSDLVRFGGHLTGFSMFNYVARNIDDILIGKFLGTGALGFYSRAYRLLMLPLKRVNSPVGTVALPALSRLQDDPERYRRAYCRILRSITLVTLPGVAYMICSADWLIEIVLGTKWLPSARIFFFLGIASLVQPISYTTGWLFITQGRGRDMLRWGAFGAFTVTVSVVAGLPFGVEGVAISYAGVNLLVRAPILYWYVGRSGPVRTRDIYSAVGPATLVALTVLGTLGLLRWQVTFTSPLIGALSFLALTLVCTGVVLALTAAGRDAARNALLTLRMLRSGS